MSLIQVAPDFWSMDRSLKWTAASDRIACGTGTTLDNVNLQQGSWASWCTIGALTANHRFFQKGIATSNNFFNIQLTNTRLFSGINRATTDCEARADFAAFPGMFNPAGLMRNPIFCAGTWDLATATNNKIIVGNFLSPPREPITYVNQSTGSGVQTSNTGEVAYVGNNKNFNVPFVGTMSFFGMWDRVFRGNEFLALWRNPMAFRDPSCKLLLLPGDSGAATTQIDLSGKGNDGTVTGTTLCDGPYDVFTMVSIPEPGASLGRSPC